MSFKKFDGSVWQSINPKQLKGTPYTGTLPAVLAGTKAGYLHKYKIYGNLTQNGTPTPENPIYPSECGERTENLINVQPFTIEGDGRSHYVPMWSGTLPVGTYVISLNQYNDLVSALRNTLRITIGGTTYYESLTSGYHLQSGQHKMTFTISDSSQSVEIQYWGNQLGNDCSYSNVMLNSGSTPLPYEPYGYKLPLLSGSTPVDIYIGDDTLSTEEYIDSGTGKIYRMVDGTLTPVDPPISFPQIPTTANSTTITWAGSGLEPSQFDSIQEWVDIPTYKRVNGAWVEDN